MKKFAEVIQEHISKNIKTYTILIIIFLLGLILGIISINNLSDIEQTELTNYINTFITDVKDNAKIDYLQLLKTSFSNNLITVLILWFMSSTVISVSRHTK